MPTWPRKIFKTNLQQLTDTVIAMEVQIGTDRWEIDNSFGFRKFKLIRPDGGAMTIGQIASMEIQQAAAAAATSGSLTTLVDTGIGFTASEFAGVFGPAYVLIVNNDDSAGAAPEGDVRLISANTTDTLTVATDFAAAVAVSDTYVIIRPFAAEDGVEGDVAAETLGVLLGSIADNSFGWAQYYGFHTGISVAATTALTAGLGIKHGGSAVGTNAGSTDAGEHLGVWLGDNRAADTILDFWPGFITIPG